MSGYWITYQGFLPVGRSLDEQIAGSKALLALEDAMRAAGVVDLIRKDKFVTVRKKKSPSSTPSISAAAAEPPVEATQAPAEAEGQQSAAAEDLLAIPESMRRARA